MKRIFFVVFLFVISMQFSCGQDEIVDPYVLKKFELGVNAGVSVYSNRHLSNSAFVGYGVSIPIGYWILDRVEIGCKLSSHYGRFVRSASYFTENQSFFDSYITLFAKIKVPVNNKICFFVSPEISDNIINFSNSKVFQLSEDRLKDMYFQYDVGSTFGLTFDLPRNTNLSIGYKVSYAQYWKLRNELDLGFAVKI